MFKPTDIANEAMDALGLGPPIGDIEDGTKAAQVCLRGYRTCLAQLLRAAHWQFARKQQPLQLLADATGQTQGVPTYTITPWVYEYAYPNDAVAARFVPHQPGQQSPIPQGNIAIPTTPITTGVTVSSNTILAGHRLRPSRFLIAQDVNFPPPPGSQWWEVQGLAPGGQTVVLTNVPNAQLVYTALTLYPNLWDPQFRAAMVAYLAQYIALPLHMDKKLAIALRRDQIAIVKQRIEAARISDGNEGWFTTSHMAEWTRVRFSGGPWGGYGWGGGDGPGYEWCGWSSASFSDGSAY